MAASERLSPWSSQVLKLALAGVDESVVFSYIDSAGTFNLTTDQIIRFTQSGVPRDVLAAMIQHDADIVAGVREVLPSTVPSSDDDLPLIPPPSPNTVAGASLRTPASAQSLQSATAFDGYPPGMEVSPDFVLEPLDELYLPAEMQERSPVRKPYAVPLTAPILVWRTGGRMPNTVFLDPFP